MKSTDFERSADSRAPQSLNILFCKDDMLYSGPKPYKTLVKRDFLGRKEPESGPGDK